MATPRIAISNQKGRKSKARKESASKAPVAMGTTKVTVPPDIAADKTAKAKWTDAVKAYTAVGYTLSAGDAEALARLCRLYAEEADIRGRINTGAVDYFDGHKLMDAKRRLIVALEDRLFLNPVARMRGLPQQPKPQEPTEAENKFPGVF